MENPTPPTELEALLAEEPFLRKLASSLLEGEVDDLVQETYLQAMEKDALPMGTPRAWLSRILRNLASNMRRGRFRARTREARAAVHDLVPSSAELVEREERRRALLHAVQGLDEVHRRVILLRYFEGLAPRMIAKRLEVPVETVWNRLRRGLELLRKHLDSEHGGDRRAWALPLIPLATNSLVIPGAVMMSSKVKVAAVAAVLVTFLGGVVWALQGTGETEGGGHPLQLEPIVLAEDGSAVEVIATPEVVADRSLLAPEEMPATTGTLRLTVIYGDDKSPAAAMGLDLCRSTTSDPLNPRIRVRTDSKGRATIEGLEPGRYALMPDLKSRHLLTEIRAGEETELLFELSKGVNISGVVLDQDERPVPAAEISLAQFAMPGDVDRVVTMTDADGRFRIRSASGFVPVSARAKGFALSDSYMVFGEPEREVEMLIFLTTEGGKIHGQVLDPEGEPVAGARIRIGTEGMNNSVTMLPGGVKGMPRRATEALSDAEGRFQVHGIPLGTNPIRLRAAGLAPWSGEVLVEAHRSADVYIRLQAGVELSGRIRTLEGDPIAGVPVEVGESMNIDYFHTRTGTDGSYHLEGLPSGEIIVRAGDQKLGRANAALIGEPGELLTWDGRLGGVIELHGVVLDQHGNAVEHASLTAYSEAGGPGSKPWLHHASTSDKGRFTLIGCPAEGSIDLKVEVRGRVVVERQQIFARHGEVVIRVEMDSKPSVHIRGVVVDPKGRPLGDALIRVGQTIQDAVDSHTGAFDLGPLVPGKFKFRISANGHARYVSEERELFANEVWDLGNIEIPAGGTLHAVLRYKGEGLRPTPSLQVQAIDGGDPYPGYAATDIHAQVLVPGFYRLAVRGSGVANQSIPFEIRIGETTELAIDIESGLQRVFGFELPHDAQERRQIEVTIRNDDDVLLRRVIWQGQSGGFEAHASFVPGDYTITAQTAGGLKGSAQFTVEAGQATAPRIRVSLR